jgi:putative oxidoreductase
MQPESCLFRTALGDLRRIAGPCKLADRMEGNEMATSEERSAGGGTAGWVAIIVARLIYAGVFLMAATFKFISISATAHEIARAGFPMPVFLAWVAAVFEIVLVLCFLTGAYFREASIMAAAYVLFLAFAFHGPSRWAANQAEFGFFVDHFTFLAGLLFAAVYGPGRRWTISRSLLRP